MRHYFYTFLDLFLHGKIYLRNVLKDKEHFSAQSEKKNVSASSIEIDAIKCKMCVHWPKIG